MSQQGGTEVLEELGGGWLKCVDAQGVFYHNSQTKENSETPPPQFAGQAQQPDSATLKSTLGDFQVCEDAQGEFYVHTPSGQTFDQPPPQLQQLLQAQKPAVSHALSAPPVQYAAAPQAAAPVQPAKVKMTLGEWQICEDSQGEYFVHAPTGQSFDQAPPELQRLLQVEVPQATLKMTIDEWQICEDEQGEFYVHTPTGQSYEQLPAHVEQLYKKVLPRIEAEKAVPLVTAKAALPQHPTVTKYITASQPAQSYSAPLYAAAPYYGASQPYSVTTYASPVQYSAHLPYTAHAVNAF